MPKPFWNSDKFLSLSALLVSLLTLIVFVYQTDLIRKQQFRSVYPHLVLTNQASGSLNYQYVLLNQGIGPAMLKDINITHLSGEKYESLAEYVASEINEKDSIFFYNSDIYEGRLIPAGEEIPLFGMISEKELAKYGVRNTIYGANKLRSIINNDSLEVRITYESIYEESWTISNWDPRPIKN